MYWFWEKKGKIVKLSHKSSISFPCWFFNSQTRGRISLLSPFLPFPSLPLLSLSFPSPQNSQTKPKCTKDCQGFKKENKISKQPIGFSNMPFFKKNFKSFAFAAHLLCPHIKFLENLHFWTLSSLHIYFQVFYFSCTLILPFNIYLFTSPFSKPCTSSCNQKKTLYFKFIVMRKVFS